MAETVQLTEGALAYRGVPYVSDIPKVNITFKEEDKEEVRRHVRRNAALGLPEVAETEAHRGHVCIVGNGPSLGDSIDALKARRRRGEKIAAINGAVGYLKGAGIVPDFVVAADASAWVADLWEGCDPGPVYYIASCCSPAVFDALDASGCNTVIWHADNESGEREILRDELGLDTVVLRGGSTCALRAPTLFFLLGYRRMHFYGMDSSAGTNGRTHVNRDISTHGAPFRDPEYNTKLIPVNVEGRIFVTRPPWLAQVQQFAIIADRLTDLGCTITVHGDGLLPAWWRNLGVP